MGELALQLDDDLGALRPRADEGHVAANDVPELRQLVDVRASQDPADAGDPVVVRLRPLGAVALGVDAHAAELVDREAAAALAKSPLGIEDRATVVELDRDRGDRDDR